MGPVGRPARGSIMASEIARYWQRALDAGCWCAAASVSLGRRFAGTWSLFVDLAAGVARSRPDSIIGRRICIANSGASKVACSASSCGYPAGPDPNLELLRRF